METVHIFPGGRPQKAMQLNDVVDVVKANGAACLTEPLNWR
jgi:hypothetical protein